jgi:hypothetical protein
MMKRVTWFVSGVAAGAAGAVEGPAGAGVEPEVRLCENIPLFPKHFQP